MSSWYVLGPSLALRQRHEAPEHLFSRQTEDFTILRVILGGLGLQRLAWVPSQRLVWVSEWREHQVRATTGGQ